MLAKRVQVLVRRDMAEIIGTVVFEHEVEILRDIHGDSNVEVMDSDYPDAEIDANEEFDRLGNTYGANDQGQMYVERCVGRGPKQLEAMGVKKRGRPAKEEVEEA
jgi:hypothetical protein